MIIDQLQGGTGNQMFQYALGYKLAKLKNTNLKLDISRYANANVIKTYAKEKPAEPPEEIKSLKKARIFDIARKAKRWIYSPISTKYYGTETIRTYRLNNFSTKYSPLSTFDLAKLKLSSKFKVVEDKSSYVFDKSIFDISNNSYLIGFWQTYQYFEDIADEIKNEFTVSVEPTSENAKLLDEIKNSNSVCIHIRRGDYLKPAHAGHHGICSKEYYDECIKIIKEKVEDPHFFIFSDEPDWAKENIKTDAPTQVSYNTLDQEYEDIRLMYSCKHFIIANSSFSWWGAWLSKNPEKIVLAPKQWLADESIDTSDAIPKEWTRI